MKREASLQIKQHFTETLAAPKSGFINVLWKQVNQTAAFLKLIAWQCGESANPKMTDGQKANH